MRRFFVERIPPVGGLVSIAGGEARHAFTVLRLRSGDAVTLFDAEGGLYEAVICDADHRRLTARIRARIPLPPPSCEFFLCQSLLKADRFEYVIQKASELGVTALHPFISHRTVVRPRHGGEKMRRWTEIAKAAAKQSGRGAPMNILEPAELPQVLGRFGGEDVKRFILWEGEGRNDIRRALRDAGILKAVVAAVGPEGGFSDPEVETARQMGFVTVSLGDRVLRSDTAAVTVAAVVQYETGGLARRSAQGESGSRLRYAV